MTEIEEGKIKGFEPRYVRSTSVMREARRVVSSEPGYRRMFEAYHVSEVILSGLIKTPARKKLSGMCLLFSGVVANYMLTHRMCTVWGASPGWLSAHFLWFAARHLPEGGGHAGDALRRAVLRAARAHKLINPKTIPQPIHVLAG